VLLQSMRSTPAGFIPENCMKYERKITELETFKAQNSTGFTTGLLVLLSQLGKTRLEKFVFPRLWRGYCNLGNLSLYISVLFSKRSTGFITLIWIRCTLRKSKTPDRMRVRWGRPVTVTSVPRGSTGDRHLCIPVDPRK
jgi:hypothetical protein